MNVRMVRTNALTVCFHENFLRRQEALASRSFSVYDEIFLAMLGVKILFKYVCISVSKICLLLYVLRG